MTGPRRVPLPLLTGLGLLASCCATLAVAGCGSGGTSADATVSGAAAAPVSPQAPGPTPTQRRPPGVFGLIAAVDGSTLQVQGNGEQTAVTYTDSTTITTQRATSASALTIGDCVSARPRLGAATDANTTPAPTPRIDGDLPTTVAAATVMILSSDGKGCSGLDGNGFGGFGGPPGGPGTGAGAPSGPLPSPPSGGGVGGPGPDGGRRLGGFGAVGEVTARSGSSFTVTSAVPRFAGASPSASASASASARTVTVTVTDATAFTTTAQATSKAITVGQCVRAAGKVDDTGAMTATSLALSPAVDGSCTEVRGG